jgi:hypothetical protein
MKIHTHTHKHTHVFRIWCPLAVSISLTLLLWRDKVLYYNEEIKRELFKENLSLSPSQSLLMVSLYVCIYTHITNTHTDTHRKRSREIWNCSFTNTHADTFRNNPTIILIFGSDRERETTEALIPGFSARINACTPSVSRKGGGQGRFGLWRVGAPETRTSLTLTVNLMVGGDDTSSEKVFNLTNRRCEDYKGTRWVKWNQIFNFTWCPLSGGGRGKRECGHLRPVTRPPSQNLWGFNFKSIIICYSMFRFF